MELKHQNHALALAFVDGLNRTFMELKLRTEFIKRNEKLRLNRTFMELKLVLPRRR